MAVQGEAQHVQEAKDILAVHPKIVAKLPKDLDAKTLDASIKAAEHGVSEVKRLTKERSTAINEKRKSLKAMRTFVKRIRSSVNGAYGDDSNEYELVGGKRLSERKKPVRKPKKVA